MLPSKMPSMLPSKTRSPGQTNQITIMINGGLATKGWKPRVPGWRSAPPGTRPPSPPPPPSHRRAQAESPHSTHGTHNTHTARTLADAQAQHTNTPRDARHARHAHSADSTNTKRAHTRARALVRVRLFAFSLALPPEREVETRLLFKQLSQRYCPAVDIGVRRTPSYWEGGHFPTRFW